VSFEAHTLLSKIHASCTDRLDRLIGVARSCDPRTDDQAALIVGLIERSRHLNHYHTLEKRTKELETKNADLLAVVRGEPDSRGVVHPLFLPKLIGEARNKIVHLRKIIAALESNESKAVSTGDELGITLARENAELGTLRDEVAILKMMVKSIENRIELMRQRRSQYAQFFIQNPNPSLKVGDPISNLLKLWEDQGPRSRTM
jgi:hypothetical protein